MLVKNYSQVITDNQTVMTKENLTHNGPFSSYFNGQLVHVIKNSGCIPRNECVACEI